MATRVDDLTDEREQLRRLERELWDDVKRLTRKAKWLNNGGKSWSFAGLQVARRQARIVFRQARDHERMARQTHREAVRETTIIRDLRAMGMTSRCFSVEDLKARYRELVLEWHPDRSRNHRRPVTATREMARVNSAFQRLLDVIGGGRSRHVVISARVPASRRIAYASGARSQTTTATSS